MHQATVTEQLRKVIEANGLSQREIERRAEVHHGAISRLLSGERGISGKTLDKLCSYLGLELKPRTPGHK